MSKTREIANKLIDGMNDVTITSPASGQALVYNGSAWVNSVGSGVGFKNHIINGNFNVWQRGTSGTTTVGVVTYTADRWIVYSLGVGVSWSKQPTDISGESCLNVAGAAGVSTINIVQRIESYSGVALVGKAITVKYKIYSSSNRTISYGIRTADDVDNFASSTQKHTGSISLSTGWNTGNLTISSLDTTAYRGYDIEFMLGSLTSGNIAIAQVQLAEGSVATPFEQRPYGLELSLCQRYYEVIPAWRQDAYVGGQGDWYSTISFKQTKRITPSVTLQSVINGYGGTSSVVAAQPGAFQILVQPVSTSDGFFLFGSALVSAEL